MKHTQPSQGFALIGVLIIVSLVTSATIAMAIRQNSDIDLAQNIFRADQAALHAQAIDLWAANVLQQDLQQNQSDSGNDIWNRGLNQVPMQHGSVSAKIVDLQARFNVNNLALAGDEAALELERFRRLLNVLGLQPDLADAIADWIDFDNEVRYPNGAEDDYYLAQPLAYRTANQIIHEISELRKIRGMDQASYERLLPHVVALPVGVGLNINTASGPVIMSLAEGISQSQAQAIEDSTRNQPITLNATGSNTPVSASGDVAFLPKDGEGSSSYNRALAEWRRQDAEAGLTDTVEEDQASRTEADAIDNSGLFNGVALDNSGVAISSSYFAIQGQVIFADQTFIIGSILYRDAVSGEVYTIARKYGEFFY